MPYTKTNWVDKTPTNSGTPVNADNLNKIEQGIENATLQTEQHITNSDIHVTPEEKAEWLTKADNIETLQGQVQTAQDDISSLSENKADLSNGKVPKEQLPYYNNSPALYAGETPLYGTTIVDIDDEGNPVIREDGSGDYLLHLTVLGMPMLRYIGNTVKDSVTGIKYVFTITNGTVILQAIN